MTADTFLGLPSVDLATLEPGQANAVVLGVPHGIPYPGHGTNEVCAGAPAAIRARSRRQAHFISHHDFDLDGPMLPPDTRFRAVDAGDLPGNPGDAAGNAARTEDAVRSIVAAGALPIALGGDDSVPPPILRGLAAVGPLTVVQVDAHLDFRDEVSGVRDGYSSPMRRASEMAHVARIVQVGLRGVGSARGSDVEEARAAGNLIVTARELDARGVDWVLEQLPRDASVFLSFDLDGLDPSVAPAVSSAAPGGMTFRQASDLAHGLVSRCRLVGAAFTEMAPALDLNDATALVVVRLVTLLLGGLARHS